jgi:serine-type D-Ala-D-Ala carboxypeptidase/endopeptidase (penicillin-binding protein 4)
MKLRYTFVLLFSSASIAFTSAKNPVDEFVESPLLKNANISLLVKDAATNQTLYQYRPNSCTTPASTMKLVTTATALELFGSDYRFETRLAVNGKITKDSVLEGDLIVYGGGDPTLGSEKLGEKSFLPKWIAAIRAAGIKKINGRIIADESNFEDQVVNPKWTWEDMGNYYAPGIHGISYLDNTYRTIFRSGKIGTTPEIIRYEPEIPGLMLENHLKSTSISYDDAYYYGAPNSNFRTIYGQIPANRAEFTVKGDIPKPGLLLAQHLTTQLHVNGIYVSEYPSVETLAGVEGTVFYKYYSPTLREIITETNVKSNNHFAEYLFKLVGTQNVSVATTANAISTIRSFWKSRELPVDQLFQHDGSGLSPCDAVSAEFYVELLTYMRNKSKYAADFFNSLPVSGGRGTLSAVLVNTPLQGKVHAKSGTIESVKSFAGYVELKNKTLVFAILVNNPSGSTHDVVKKIEEFLLQITK